MSIIGRLSRLFKADIHGILDSLEDPRETLKQALREMEEEIAKGEEALKRLIQKEEEMRVSKGERENALKEYRNQMDLCFDSGNEALAKAILKKKLESEKRLYGIEKAIAQVGKAIDTTNRVLEEQREKLQAVLEKQRLFEDQVGVMENSSAVFGGESGEPISSLVSDEELELAYLSEQKRRAAEALVS